MLSIKSEIIENGFVIYMSKDGKEINTAVTSDCMSNPFKIKKTLNIMIDSLLNDLYPELSNIVGRTKSKIRELKEEIESSERLLEFLLQKD